MTRLEALKELAAKVENGSADHEAGAKAFISDNPEDHGCVQLAIWAQQAYHGSLDASNALHEAVLPGWSAVVGQNAHHLDWSAWVRFAADGRITQEFTFADDCPSRAWVSAILRALIAQEESA